MKKIIILFSLIAFTAIGRQFNLAFDLPSSATNGFTYHCEFYWQATNNTSTTLLAKAIQGATNIIFDSTNFTVNPVYLTGLTRDSNGNTSIPSSPFLFDINNYPPPVVLPPMPTPPTIKGVSQVITILVP